MSRFYFFYIDPDVFKSLNIRLFYLFNDLTLITVEKKKRAWNNQTFASKKTINIARGRIKKKGKSAICSMFNTLFEKTDEEQG